MIGVKTNKEFMARVLCKSLAANIINQQYKILTKTKRL